MNNLNSEIDDQALAWLVKLNAGNVSDAQEAEFFSWLQVSDLHQKAYLRAESLWEQADVVAKIGHSHQYVQHPEDKNDEQKNVLKFAPGPAQTMQQNNPPGKKDMSVNGPAGWAMAACTLLAVGIGGFYTFYPSQKNYHLVSQVGEQQQILLEDGSRVLLSSNSQLDVQLTARHRIATLSQGEVYFDVSRNLQKPFEVITKAGMVRVLGTHFSVRQQADGDAIVTVAEGRVALGKLPQENQSFAPLKELHNNQQLSLKQAAMGATPQSINAQIALAWKEKQLVFQKQKLNFIVAELNRYFALNITVPNTDLGEKEITAVIQLSDVKTTLNTLCQALKLQAEFAPNGQDIVLSAIQ